MTPEYLQSLRSYFPFGMLPSAVILDLLLYYRMRFMEALRHPNPLSPANEHETTGEGAGADQRLE